jgi:hypoxanthine-guanine phosphoribosyltransferase
MVCDRHEEVIEQLDDHEDRIKYLELSDTEVRADLKNLINTVKELISWIKIFFFGCLGGAVMFVIWYIQSL